LRALGRALVQGNDTEELTHLHSGSTGSNPVCASFACLCTRKPA
jgi:hypothetical protein